MLLKQTKNWVVKIGFIAASFFVLNSCASFADSPSAGAPKPEPQWDERSAYPPRIDTWIQQNPDAYYGVGISAMDGSESFSISQARTRALGELTRSVQVSAAYIGRSYEEAGFAEGSEATKNRSANILNGARTVGPMKGNGNFYVLQYIPRSEFDKSMKEEARQSRVKISEAELDKLLDEAQQKSK